MGWLITIVLCIAPQFIFDLDHNGHVFMYIGGSYLLAVFAFYLLTFIYACIRGGEESNSQNTPKMNKQIKVKSKKHRKGSRKSSYQYSTDYTDYSSSSGSDTCSSSSSDSSGSCD